MAERPFFGSGGKPILAADGRPAFEGSCGCNADFSFANTTGREFDFTDETTPTATVWAWDFGDGNTATTQDPTHTFAADGRYYVKLTSTTADGTCEVTLPVDVGTPTACSGGWTNVDSFSYFKVTVSGFADNFACTSCDAEMNTDWLLGPNCTFTAFKPFCQFGEGGGNVSYNHVAAELTINAGRLDNDDDGNPAPTHEGSVAANYRASVSDRNALNNTTTYFSSITVNLLGGADTTPENGPCTLSPPSSLVVSLV